MKEWVTRNGEYYPAYQDPYGWYYQSMLSSKYLSNLQLTAEMTVLESNKIKLLRKRKFRNVEYL